jgi:hypothetical protein
MATSSHAIEAVREDDYVICECVREGSRLRVRITSPGYYHDANCMFPRDMRLPGRKFRVRQANIRLITSRNKYYYSAGSRTEIEVLSDADATAESLKKLKIYEDTTAPECAICFAAPKDTIIDPCGHFYMCATCAQTVTQCPICRGHIAGRIHKSQMQV